MTKENTFYKGNGKKIMKKKQREGKNGPITFYLFPMVVNAFASVAKCRGSWVVGRGRGSLVWVERKRRGYCTI